MFCWSVLIQEVESPSILFNKRHIWIYLSWLVKKWIPAIKDQWLVITTYLEPHVQLICTKSVEAYEASKIAIAPYVVKGQEFAEPYFQVKDLLYCLCFCPS